MDFMKTLFKNNQSIDLIPIDHYQPMNPAERTSENAYSFNVDENYNHPTIFFTSSEILQTTNSQLPAVEYVENDLFHSAPNPMGNKFFPYENSDLIMELNSNFRSVETEASQIYLDEFNGSTSTNSNSGTTTTATNPSNVGTPLSNDEDSTPFFDFESCNDEMDFMKTLFKNNQSIDLIPIDHYQPMNPAERTSENAYSFNVDENYNHPTIFFTSSEILQTTNSQLPAVEYVENDLFHSAPNPMGNKFFPYENSDLIMELNSNFRSDGDNVGNKNLTTNLPTIDQGRIPDAASTPYPKLPKNA
ncbi:Hypothetical predicted protein [Olea europaea subsp. europaea]|uniref:Uncharacterized protein n=1 Tax=Olea europaea subsp. europaea TaxID=158383 RepID=A0A8S0PH74_OLEEU|nr:Hypothetical predicted protein [Olea europaea subsp. europaea]